MGENSYFRKALNDFTFEAANGGAIRHLADSGYTVKQIMESLDFPASRESVRNAVWAHLERQGIIAPERPGCAQGTGKAVYVKEYDRYGKASFRRVMEREEVSPVTEWQEQDLGGTAAMSPEALFGLLEQKIRENGAEYSYASFAFGQIAGKDSGLYETMLSVFDNHQREYVTGLPWNLKPVYHRLDSRMLGILMQLHEAGLYHGECCFVKTGELFRL